MSDNLNKIQFPDDYPAGKPLKSKWIPVQTDRKSLAWHILDRHTRWGALSTSASGIPARAKNDAPARNGMSDEEYHEHLHSIGHFDKDSEHEHFTPKNRRFK